MVSVWMVTYNHARYIARAIESVLMQRTSFDYRLVIGDDCSTDGTTDIVKRYQATHPGAITAVCQTKNVGAMRNAYESALPLCTGRYIACLEGDDYWTDPDKLQQQVDFLEANPDYALCFHRVVLSYPRTVANLFRRRRSSGRLAPTLTIADLCRRNFIYTASCMVRNHRSDVLPPWFDRVTPLDWPYFVLAARHGKIGFINETMAVYRIHQTGAWGGAPAMSKWLREIEMLRLLSDHLGRPDCQPAIDEAIREREDAIAGLPRKRTMMQTIAACIGKARGRG